MRYLLQLDLEATPELCRAGLAWVEDEFAKAYRPKPDNPLPYRPLIAVLGPRRSARTQGALESEDACLQDREVAEKERRRHQAKGAGDRDRQRA